MKNILLIFCLLVTGIVFFTCKDNKTENIIINGLLYYHNDLLTLVPCSNRDIIVTITDNTENLVKSYKDTLEYYYTGEAAYAELKGNLHKLKQNFFSDEPDSYNFTVNEIVGLNKKTNIPYDCLYCDYSGGNHNRSWTFEISEIEELITLRDDDLKQSFYFDYVEPIEEGDDLIYISQNPVMENRIEIKINLLMQAGELSGEKEYPAEIILNKRQYRGYARRCS